MANQLSITNDEFASAIIFVHDVKKSMKAFLGILISPGPKEKHAGWIKVCERIRQVRNIPAMNKTCRKKVHALFMENFNEIEKLIWNGIMFKHFMSVHTNGIFSILSEDEKISNDENNPINN